jgi:Bacterial Ig-like domain
MTPSIELLSRPNTNSVSTSKSKIVKVGEKVAVENHSTYQFRVDGVDGLPKGTKITKRKIQLHIELPDGRQFELNDWCSVSHSKLIDLVDVSVLDATNNNWVDGVSAIESTSCAYVTNNGITAGSVGSLVNDSAAASDSGISPMALLGVLPLAALAGGGSGGGGGSASPDAGTSNKSVLPSAGLGADSTGIAGDAQHTAKNKPTISGTGKAGDKITVTMSSGEVIETVVDASGQWSVTPTQALAEGNATVVVVATTPGMAPSGPVSLSFTVDTTAPAAPVQTLTMPESAAGEVNQAMAAAGLPMTVTLPSGAVAGDTLTSTITNPDGTTSTISRPITAAEATAGSASVVIPPANLSPDGAYSVTSSVTDLAGNVGAASAASTFTVDQTAPLAPSNTVAAASDGIISQAEATSAGGVPVTVALPAGSVAGDTVTLTITKPDGSSSTIAYTLLAADVAGGSASVLIPTAGLSPDGAYSVTSKVTDLADNVSAASTVSSFTVDQTAVAPLQVIVGDNVWATGMTPSGATYQDAAVSSLYVSSSGNGRTTDDNTPTFYGNAGAVEGLATVNLYANGVLLGSPSALADGSWSFTPAAPMANAVYLMTLTQTDLAGNVSVLTSNFEFRVNVTSSDVIGASSGPGDVVDNTLLAAGKTYGMQAGDDTVQGGSGTDIFNDYATWGGGADIYSGGGGDDTAHFGESDTANDNFDGGAGTDTISYVNGGVSSPLTFTFNDNLGYISGTVTGATTGTDTILHTERYAGGSGADSMNFSGLATMGAVAWGARGDDTITMGAGNDVVFENGASGAGADSIDLGAGNDTLYVGNESVVANDSYNLGLGNDSFNSASGPAVSRTFTFSGTGASAQAIVTATDLGTDTILGAEIFTGHGNSDLFILNTAYTEFVNGGTTPGYGYFYGSVPNSGQFDTIQLGTGGGANLDLTASGVNLLNIQIVDMITNTAANTLTLNQVDVINMGALGVVTGAGPLSATRSQVVVNGTDLDTITDGAVGNTSGWSLEGTTIYGGETYNVYNSSSNNTQLLVDLDILQSGLMT